VNKHSLFYFRLRRPQPLLLYVRHYECNLDSQLEIFNAIHNTVIAAVRKISDLGKSIKFRFGNRLLLRNGRVKYSNYHVMVTD